MAMRKRPRIILLLAWLLILLSTGQWIRAQFVHDWFRWLRPRPGRSSTAPLDTPATVYVIELSGAGIALVQFDCWMNSTEPFGFERLHAPPAKVTWQERHPRASRLWWKTHNEDTLLHVPYWSTVASGGAIVGAHTMLARRRRRRLDMQHCYVCGYNLCATPQRCPECGAVPREVSPIRA
jgi:hypothetical protein